LETKSAKLGKFHSKQKMSSIVTTQIHWLANCSLQTQFLKKTATGGLRLLSANILKMPVMQPYHKYVKVGYTPGANPVTSEFTSTTAALFSNKKKIVLF
jgi:hypothetical protein